MRAVGITDPDLLEAVDFYRTDRGYSEHSANRRYFTSLGPMLGFDAFHLVGEMLTQPVEVIVAGRLGATFSYADGQTLFERANNRHGFHVVDGTGHYDIYDKSPYIDEAVATLATFFGQTLVKSKRSMRCENCTIDREDAPPPASPRCNAL